MAEELRSSRQPFLASPRLAARCCRCRAPRIAHTRHTRTRWDPATSQVRGRSEFPVTVIHSSRGAYASLPVFHPPTLSPGSPSYLSVCSRHTCASTVRIATTACVQKRSGAHADEGPGADEYAHSQDRRGHQNGWCSCWRRAKGGGATFPFRKLQGACLAGCRDLTLRQTFSSCVSVEWRVDPGAAD